MRLLGMTHHTDQPNGRVAIHVRCPLCKKQQTVIVSRPQFVKLRSGEGLIQNILPEYNAEQRELVQTGICGECWG